MFSLWYFSLLVPKISGCVLMLEVEEAEESGRHECLTVEDDDDDGRWFELAFEVKMLDATSLTDCR